MMYVKTTDDSVCSFCERNKLDKLPFKDKDGNFIYKLEDCDIKLFTQFSTSQYTIAKSFPMRY